MIDALVLGTVAALAIGGMALAVRSDAGRRRRRRWAGDASGIDPDLSGDTGGSDCSDGGGDGGGCD